MSVLSAGVVDGDQWMGCVSNNVHTNQLLVWDTPVVLAAIWTL